MLTYAHHFVPHFVTMYLNDFSYNTYLTATSFSVCVKYYILPGRRQEFTCFMPL